MKRMEYQVLVNKLNHGTEEEPNIEQIFGKRVRLCSNDDFESNYAIAQAEAYNGEVTVEEE